MARPVKFGAERILDASRELVVGSGPAALTMTAVAGTLGAPSGSLYHRFATRDALAAALWVRTVRRFQEGYLIRLRDPDPLTAALGAAAHVVTWSRDHLEDARLLLLFRSRDLLRGDWPAASKRDTETLRRRLRAGLDDLQAALGARNPDARQRVSFAVVDVPYAAVRPFLVAGRPPPRAVDGLVAETVEHVLGPLIDRD